MRIVYFLTSYRSPEQLLRLVRTLSTADPESRCVVHHDVFASPAPVAELEALGARLVTSDHPIVWGDMTLEAVRWRVFAELLDGPDFDWVVLLSEQDYPVAPPSALHAHLADSGGDAVIEAVPIEEIADDGLRYECGLRYNHTYLSLPSTGLAHRLPPAVGRALRSVRLFLYMAFNKVQKRVRFYFLPAELDLPTRVGLRRGPAHRSGWGPVWYSGAWYALSRRAVEHVVDVVRDQPELVRWAERTIIPLESATATIVGNAPHLVMVDEPLHHIRWSNRLSGRPDELGLADFDELVSSGRFFARKFSHDDSVILDKLDGHVRGAVISASSPRRL